MVDDQGNMTFARIAGRFAPSKPLGYRSSRGNGNVLILFVMPEIQRSKGDVFELEPPEASFFYQAPVVGRSPGSLTQGFHEGSCQDLTDSWEEETFPIWFSLSARCPCEFLSGMFIIPKQASRDRDQQIGQPQ